jgi:hypothetical protein
MSQIKVDQITDEAGTGAPDFPNGLQVAGASLSGVADQSTAEAGSDNEVLMTPLRVEEHMTANALGWGQTPQDVSGSRAVNTSYQNTTGRPIFVAISFTSSNRLLQASSDNSTWIDVGSMGSSSNVYQAASGIVIPVNWYYRVAAGGGTNGTLRIWAEVR